ncbi:MAG: hypothetical protein ACFB0B_17635 [Thermonemataceae bacterium]
MIFELVLLFADHSLSVHLFLSSNILPHRYFGKEAFGVGEVKAFISKNVFVTWKAQVTSSLKTCASWGGSV